MLRFNVHVLCLERSRLNHFAQTLHDNRLRRNGVCGNHLRPRKAHTLGKGFVTGKELLHAHSASFSCASSA